MKEHSTVNFEDYVICCRNRANISTTAQCIETPAIIKQQHCARRVGTVWRRNRFGEEESLTWARRQNGTYKLPFRTFGCKSASQPASPGSEISLNVLGHASCGHSCVQKDAPLSIIEELKLLFKSTKPRRDMFQLMRAFSHTMNVQVPGSGVHSATGHQMTTGLMYGDPENARFSTPTVIGMLFDFLACRC